MACGILVPWPGIEPASPALGGGFFTTGPPEKSPVITIISLYRKQKNQTKVWRDCELAQQYMGPFGLKGMIFSVYHIASVGAYF